MFLLSTRSLAGYGLDHIFQIAKAAGCDGIDLSIALSEYDTLDADYVDLIRKRHDIQIISVTAPIRKLTRKLAEKIVEFAEKLDIAIVNFAPPHRLDRDKEWFGEGLKVLLAKYPKITINIVNAPPKTWLFVISEYGDARPETIKKITGHTALSIENVEVESGVDLMKTFTLLGNTLTMVYYSDKDGQKNGMFPGTGSMPLESLLIRMKEAGYNGIFSLDVDPESLDAGSSDTQIITKITEARSFLQKYFI